MKTYQEVQKAFEAYYRRSHGESLCPETIVYDLRKDSEGNYCSLKVDMQCQCFYGGYLTASIDHLEKENNRA